MTTALRLAIGSYYALLFAIPALALAQTGMPRQIVPCTGVACKCSDIVILIQNLINTGIVLVTILSALMFAYAGFLYLTNQANPGQIEGAKKIFSNVTIGLVIMLGAWLIVDTLMKSVVGGSFGPWNAVEPVEGICRSLGLTGQ